MRTLTQPSLRAMHASYRYKSATLGFAQTCHAPGINAGVQYCQLQPGERYRRRNLPFAIDTASNPA
jgi:hypothetical protein